MTSPYSVASLTRIASRTSASPMSRGRKVTTSCRTPRSAVRRRAYARSSLPSVPTVNATQSGCILAHVGQGQGAVEPAGEDHADGQVGVDPDPHRLAVGVPDEVHRGLEVLDHGLALAELQQVDVRVQLGRGARFGPAAMTRRHLVDDNVGAQRADQGLDLGGDGQPAADQRPVERLDPGGVTSEEYAAGMPVDQTEGELTPEAQQGVLAPGQHALERHLGVGDRPQLVTLAQQLLAQALEVEDLAVVGQRPAAVRRRPRLHRAVAVDDPQPVRAEQGLVVEEGLLDLAARPHRLEHGREGRGVLSGARADEQGDATHLVDHSQSSCRQSEGQGGVTVRKRRAPG